jgi:hypothetical protein
MTQLEENLKERGLYDRLAVLIIKYVDRCEFDKDNIVDARNEIDSYISSTGLSPDIFSDDVSEIIQRIKMLEV